MPTFARQSSQTFPHGRIEAFNQRGIELLASCRQGQQVVRFLKRSPAELARDFHHPFLLGMLDTGRNTQIRPDFSTASSSASRPFDFVWKGPHNALWIRIPAISTDQQTWPPLAPPANRLQEVICQLAVSIHTDDSC